MATRVAGARDVALSEMNFRGFVINTAETAITLVSSDAGIIFIQNNSAATTYTLPTVTDCEGKMFIFLNSNTATSTVITSTTSLIKGKQTAGATSTVLTSAALGDFLIIVGDGTYFYTIAGASHWTRTS